MVAARSAAIGVSYGKNGAVSVIRRVENPVLF
jgi:hypothetical protein